MGTISNIWSSDKPKEMELEIALPLKLRWRQSHFSNDNPQVSWGLKSPRLKIVMFTDISKQKLRICINTIIIFIWVISAYCFHHGDFICLSNARVTYQLIVRSVILRSQLIGSLLSSRLEPFSMEKYCPKTDNFCEKWSCLQLASMTSHLSFLAIWKLLVPRA